MCEVNADFDDFARRMRITEFFYDHTTDNESNPFYPKSLWTPPTDRDDALNAFFNAVKNDLLTTKPKRICDNLPKPHRQALRKLKHRKDIVIESADKGSAKVIMDNTWYLEECYRQLNNPTFYEKQDTDWTHAIQKRDTEYAKRTLNNGLIDNKNKQYLLHKNPKPGRFYILPKIHKDNNPGRPIVCSNNHPTERISQFVDFHLKLLVCTIPSYVKDTTTTDFLNKAFNRLPGNALLVTLDVTTLCTNIPHDEGIDACRYFLQKRADKPIPTETICDLIRVILIMNNFTFNSKHYLQKLGTTMGTRMAPSYANLFLGKFALLRAPYQPYV